MVLGKYYCDYCDKQFQDTPSARKRHLQGLQHLRAKALWYDSLSVRDSNQLYAHAFPKGVCSRFVKTRVGSDKLYETFKGFCPFGDSCKYFHPKNTSPLEAETQATGFIDKAQSSSVDPRIHLVRGSSSPVVRDSMGMPWGNLPPSLKPPPDSGYPPLPFVDWG